ncbi:IclR family transcriptional regulator [Bacillus sp. SA1-12]|nr:IclR family transcriptional regulator [Bacillus sp. SA1-12]KKI92058.1 IclR family transcriptional regulator [Bacillus sp. SA1-12]
MKEKYWVPAIERADMVLKEISKYPHQLRLIDLSKRLNINKSSLFSLLKTLEYLGWIVKDGGDVYSLGPSIGAFSSSYLSQFNLLQSFYKEAALSVSKVNEHIQLGVLQKTNVVYLGKVEGDSGVRLITDPGMQFPAYASSIGKIQLIQYTKQELRDIFSEGDWERKTPYTTSNIDELYEKVQTAKQSGYAIENQEAALGFHCVAAPVYNFEYKVIAGVSFSMTTSSWEFKKEAARDEIIKLADRLSQLAGFTGELKQNME